MWDLPVPICATLWRAQLSPSKVSHQAVSPDRLSLIPVYPKVTAASQVLHSSPCVVSTTAVMREGAWVKRGRGWAGVQAQHPAEHHPRAPLGHSCHLNAGHLSAVYSHVNVTFSGRTPCALFWNQLDGGGRPKRNQRWRPEPGEVLPTGDCLRLGRTPSRPKAVGGWAWEGQKLPEEA